MCPQESCYHLPSSHYLVEECFTEATIASDDKHERPEAYGGRIRRLVGKACVFNARLRLRGMPTVYNVQSITEQLRVTS